MKTPRLVVLGVVAAASGADLPTKFAWPKVVKFQLRPDPLAK